MTNETIIFLHIPKTAGTTLHHIIDRQYPEKSIFSLGPYAQKSIKKFKQMSDEQKARTRMLQGHMGYGLHRFIPHRTQYFTLLRDPIERVISFYYFIRRNEQHYLFDFVETENRSLKEFMESQVTPMVNDAQVRMISGVWLDTPFGECTPGLLESAKVNLRDNFAVVGLTERFDETLLLLKRQFGWTNVFYRRQNVTKSRPTKNDLPPDILRSIVDANKLDIQLYEYAQELFEQRLKQQSFAFQIELAVLRGVNLIQQLVR